MKLTLVATVLLGVLSVATAFAQVPMPPPPPLEGFRVFLDCRGRCDENYIRTELTYVDHVRDREVADVHILVTTQGSGGGGTEYTINFIGLRRFLGVEDTITYTTIQDDTSDEIRRGLLQALKLGLVRYLAQTPLRSSLDVSYRELARDQRPAQALDDRWNFWVFRARGNANTNGEESSMSLRLSGSFSASRVTEGWKSSVNLNLNYRRNRYDFEEKDSYISISRDSSASGLLVRTLGGHWGSGARMSVSSSTYTNQHRTVRLSPALEYNVFPYSETTRRQLTLRYTAGATSFDYIAPTIYGKMAETLVSHAFAANLDLRQPWGTMDLQAEASQYVPDFRKNRISFQGRFDVRIFRGFSLDLGADASFIRDQIYLPAGTATPEEILLRQRQIATGYDYGFRMGFSYSFGSVYNNVVNSRLSGF
jgi:hypothetical protein